MEEYVNAVIKVEDTICAIQRRKKDAIAVAFKDLLELPAEDLLEVTFDHIIWLDQQARGVDVLASPFLQEPEKAAEALDAIRADSTAGLLRVGQDGYVRFVMLLMGLAATLDSATTAAA